MDDRPRTTRAPLPLQARNGDDDHAALWAKIHQAEDHLKRCDDGLERCDERMSQIEARLNIHDARAAQLEHELNGIRQTLTQIHLAVNAAMRDFGEQETKFEAKLTEQFLRHEARESAMQMRVMIYGVGLLITALGALAWYVLSHVRLGA